MTNYVKESKNWLQPGVNLQFLVWLLLLGLPAFLLFLIYSKELNRPEAAAPVVHSSMMQQHR